MFKSFLAALLFTSASTAGAVRAYAPCSNTQTEMSVEGVEGIFCVDSSRICMGKVGDGACPTVQDGLPYGSYCGLVATNVYGCKALPSEPVKTYQPSGATTEAPVVVTPTPTSATPWVTPSPTTTAPPATTPTPTSAAHTACGTSTPSPWKGSSSPSSSGTSSRSNCPNGQSEMSVEGVKGFFCVEGGPLCSADVSTGLCPGKSDRLPIGSYCGVVASGVYGCKILDAQSLATFSPITTTPTPTTTAPVVASAIPAATPTPTASTPLSSYPASSDCPNGGTPMSVEGIQKVFCVPGVPCAGAVFNGTCPFADPDLPKGAFCDIVRPGVYGCKPIV